MNDLHLARGDPDQAQNSAYGSPGPPAAPAAGALPLAPMVGSEPEVPMIALGWLGCGFLITPDPAVPEGTDAGDRLPRLDLRDDNGDPMRITDVGGDPVLLELATLWASPSFEDASAELQASYADEGLRRVVVLVQDVSGELADHEDAELYATEYGVRPVAWDPTGDTVELLGAPSFPWYWVIAPDGVVYGSGPDARPLLADYYADR